MNDAIGVGLEPTKSAYKVRTPIETNTITVSQTTIIAAATLTVNKYTLMGTFWINLKSNKFKRGTMRKW